LIIVTDFLTVYGRHTERFLSSSLIAITPSCYIFLFIGKDTFVIESGLSKRVQERERNRPQLIAKQYECILKSLNLLMTCKGPFSADHSIYVLSAKSMNCWKWSLPGEPWT